MSSERAGDLNRDWPGRADVFRSYGGELDQDMVDQLDRAHTPSERAGTPTPRALNREQAEEVVHRYTTGHMATSEFLDALEACVLPDPRALERERDVIDALYREEQARDAAEAKLARIETEVYGMEKPQNLEAALFMRERVRAILRGDQ